MTRPALCITQDPKPAAKRGPRLTERARAFLVQLLIEGQANAEIREAMATAGHPADLTDVTLYRYRKSARVQAALQRVTEEMTRIGILNRTHRLLRLRERAEQYNFRINGFDPNPFNPHHALPGPPVVIDNETFGQLSTKELGVLREIDRLMTPIVISVSQTDEEKGKVTQYQRSEESYLLAMKNHVNDLMIRYYAEKTGQTVEAVRAEMNADIRAQEEAERNARKSRIEEAAEEDLTEEDEDDL